MTPSELIDQILDNQKPITLIFKEENEVKKYLAAFNREKRERRRVSLEFQTKRDQGDLSFPVELTIDNAKEISCSYKEKEKKFTAYWNFEAPKPVEVIVGEDS